MDNGYSLADIGAVANGSGWGDNSIVTLLLLFALMGGGFGWGNRGDYGQFATAASQQDILFGQKFSDLDNKMDRGFTSLGNGISSATFSLNNSIKDGNAMVAGRVVDEGRGLQMQIADHNCMIQKNIDSVRFDMANYANAINKNFDDKFAELEKNQLKAQVDAQAQEINRLYIAQQMCGVVRYPNGMTYDAGPSPFCSCGNGCCR